jgi:hypothetical protein
MLNFCTLFDINYLSYGLSLHESLKQHCKKFTLYIFAFDKRTENYLKEISLKNTIIISLDQFEDQELLKVKPSRTVGEYCWTCTPSTILYILQNYNVDHCTYIDSDIYFFSDPQKLIDEMGDKSVSIISHRYTPKLDQSKTSGKYCVQFMTFKNNFGGLKVLEWWRDACLDWCYSRFEDGKFGDQKYLDDWPKMFDCVHEIENLGAGVAPWNVEQYNFKIDTKNKICGMELNTNKQFNLIFYHFHGLMFLDKYQGYRFTNMRYLLTNDIKNIVYQKYLTKMASVRNNLLLKKVISDKSLFGTSLKNIIRFYLPWVSSKNKNYIIIK